MGDFANLLASLNLSPINTLLLAVLVFILKRIHERLQTLEQITLRNANSIAFLKGKLGLEEDNGG